MQDSLTLHSFSLKLCSATIDLKHSLLWVKIVLCSSVQFSLGPQESAKPASQD